MCRSRVSRVSIRVLFYYRIEGLLILVNFWKCVATQLSFLRSHFFFPVISRVKNEAKPEPSCSTNRSCFKLIIIDHKIYLAFRCLPSPSFKYSAKTFSPEDTNFVESLFLELDPDSRCSEVGAKVDNLQIMASFVFCLNMCQLTQSIEPVFFVKEKLSCFWKVISMLIVLCDSQFQRFKPR